MKFSVASAFVAALAAQSVVASNWFSKAAYNKWHETELERWLSDHDVPYPSPADRKDLENLVKTNWQSAVSSPYASWEPARLQKYLQQQGKEVQKGTEKNKDALVKQVKSSWSETEDQASDAYSNVRDWILDSWTESQLKAFCDKHGVPVPQPRTRDNLYKAARENLQSTANKLNEASNYPGNWLYDSWSDSDIKAFLDERGIPVPQPSKRDKLVATMRRNARVAALQAKSQTAAASSSAQAAVQSVSDQVLDTWSDSQIKEWADKNGIKVPQGSKRNELLALARKNMAKLSGDNVASDASRSFGAATSSANNEFARATDDAALKANDLYGQAYGLLTSYIDQVKELVGLKPNYASSASSAAASASRKGSAAYQKATAGAKMEL